MALDWDILMVLCIIDDLIPKPKGVAVREETH